MFVRKYQNMAEMSYEKDRSARWRTGGGINGNLGILLGKLYQDPEKGV